MQEISVLFGQLMGVLGLVTASVPISSSLMRRVALPFGYIGTWRHGLVPSGRWPQTSARLNILRIRGLGEGCLRSAEFSSQGC